MYQVGGDVGVDGRCRGVVKRAARPGMVWVLLDCDTDTSIRQNGK